jgi:hypothetical protein
MDFLDYMCDCQFLKKNCLMELVFFFISPKNDPGVKRTVEHSPLATPRD